ncbi:hypothetical protein V5O48_011328 [Marasmius crinis-equi]|uniref:Uncharacterized protein n=1 Tax=Marasmius crinis-equi TaxID=585013 RepID=A0ABR3F615_9AGAR
MSSQRLQKLYGTDFASWATDGSKTDQERSELLSKFRDTVTRSTIGEIVEYFGPDQEALARLVASSSTVEALSDWIEEGCSALDLIQGDLARCEEGRTTTHRLHTSSPENVIYASDPIRMRLETGKTHAALLRAMVIVKSYDQKSKPWFLPPPPLPHHFMASEADVNTFNVVQVYLPTIKVLNGILESVGAPHRLSLRSQGRPQTGSGAVDYFIACHGSRGPAGRVEAKDDKKGTPLCLMEDKPWKSCGELERWCQKPQPLVASDTGHKKVQKIIGQVRKYVFFYETPYTIVSDGVRYIGLVWGQCEHWKLGATHRFTPEYSFPHYISRKEHEVRTVIGYNASTKGEPKARMVVMALCIMALQDLGALKRR